ncbi:hypothetical protein OUZ56_024250 [Daphnia magna]|uniref:Uncharacterized protein n=1 Tax=Daphnia magna TaxID=35525 RepID=A0ABR0B0F5_9CRUS|nr:hypothetical protein OUZ56_024250 [Daphnia magna]
MVRSMLQLTKTFSGTSNCKVPNTMRGYNHFHLVKGNPYERMLQVCHCLLTFNRPPGKGGQQACTEAYFCAETGAKRSTVRIQTGRDGPICLNNQN